uniref:Myb-like domain-containing protein n=1 Tax=Oryza punctata TaxID=4537 RepID=A0A0E0LJV5_ORYPU
MDQGVIMATQPPPPPPRARCVVRLKLSPAWTPEEDALLQRLAKENGFRRWSRVARSMPRRSTRSCRTRWRHHLARDVYHRPFTARDDDELLRLHYRLGDRWKEIGRAVYGRTSRVMKHRWRELRRSGFPPAAAARKEQAPAMDADDMAESEVEGSDQSLPPRELHRPLADALASSFGSCSLAHDHAMDPLAGSLALGFACMAV